MSHSLSRIWDGTEGRPFPFASGAGGVSVVAPIAALLMSDPRFAPTRDAPRMDGAGMTSRSLPARLDVDDGPVLAVAVVAGVGVAVFGPEIIRTSWMPLPTGE